MSTSTEEFAAPASSSGIKWEDYTGALLLFTVNGVETAIKTTFGDKDAVRADVTILDGAHAGTEYNDALVFPSVLLGQLRPNIGRKVLGRLTQGEAKPGQKPPWKLAEATDADKTIARTHLSKNAQPPF